MRSVNFHKSVYFLIKVFLLLGFCLKLQGQTDTVINPEQFVFDEFTIGVVKLKTGDKVVLNLNYNIVTEKMVFMQKGKIFNIVNQSAIDTVYIMARRFIPVGKVFYEVLVSKPVSLFLQNKGSVKAPPRPAAYGGTSDVSSSTYINNLSLGNDVYRMNRNAEIKIVVSPVFWIRKNNVMYAVSKRKQLFKIFPDKRSVIKEFIRQSQVGPENTRSLVQLVNALN
jgi:hypothetical protein